MESNIKKQFEHVLPHRKQRAPRKRTSSLSYEERKSTQNVEENCKSVTFPAPLWKPHRPLSETIGYISESDSDSESDTNACQYHDISSSHTCVRPRLRYQGYQSEGSPVPLHTLPCLLPPIGVFWDIENCQVPKGRSAVAVAQVIRKRFFTGFREAEFLVVCDVKKESNQIVQELNDAQVNLIHVASICKNAADEKLRQSMRRFADIHGSPASIILISGDINFAADINDLRHRKKINVILLHMENTSENLILCASEHYNFSELVESLPPRGAIKQSSQPVEVLVYNLPPEKDSSNVKSRLRQLSDNCGGRVTALKQTCATIRFASLDVAIRAQKRMDGEDVFGRKIQVSQPVRVVEKEGSPQKYTENFTGKKFQMNGGRDNVGGWSVNAVPSTSSLYHCVPTAAFNLFGSSVNQPPYLGNWSVYGSASTSVNVAQEYYTGICTGFHIPSVDVAANAQSFSAFRGQNSSFLLPRNPSSEINVPCGILDTAPKVLRKIRGTHKGLMPLETDHSEKDINQQAIKSAISRLQSRQLVKAGPSDIPSQVCNTNNRNSTPLVVQSDVRCAVKQSSSKERSAGMSRTPTPVLQQYDGDLDEPEHFFHPINSSDLSNVNGSNSSEPVELHVSNLDRTFGAREMKKILLSAFKEHVTVLSLLVLVQQDGSLNALVRLASQQDAQYAIYKLQRHKIGHKRIRICHGSVSRPSPQLIRSQVITLLQEVPNHRLPLFKFCELYERRFLCSISISDIYKVKECEVTDGPRGRIVSLLIDARNSPSPQLQVLQEMEVLEPSFCPLHGLEVQPNRGWAEQEVSSLPYVNISLKLLAVRVHALLQTHNGSIHINSLPQCYLAQFESLQEDKDGVALEHLVSCLPGVEIFSSPAHIKYLRWSKTGSISSSSSKTDEEFAKTNTSLAGKLSVFRRELVDLLKTSPRCQILFDKFIPAYHHHFGRQCRVADYGFTKLIELLESLPHTVQVLGEGNRRMVTLSHSVQLRHFMGDLMRVLRGQLNKQVLLSELPDAFERVFNKPFIVNHYGVCDVMDLLSDLPDASLVVTPVNETEDDMLIAIPKHEQTPEEIEKTKQFAAEMFPSERGPYITLQDIKINVHRILIEEPHWSMDFNVLAKKCKQNYNQKLSLDELTLVKEIEVTETDGKIIVRLGSAYVQQQFIQEIQKLVHESGGSLPLASVELKYYQKYGRPCNPAQFGFSSLGALLQTLRGAVRLKGRGSRRSVVLAEIARTSAAGTAVVGASLAEMTATSNTPKYTSITTTISVPDLQGDSSSTCEGDSGHDETSSSAVDVDSSLSSGSKVQFSEKSCASEVHSDVGTSMNGCDPVGHTKQSTPGKGPWSRRAEPHLLETDSPAAMLSPSSYLLPAFSTHKASSNLVMCHLPPLYSYPPFLPGHVASPEPSTLPLPQLSLAAPLLIPQETQPPLSLNDSSNSSTPNKTKVKRRLAAQFHTPLDLP